jgi:cysteine desulfurase
VERLAGLRDRLLEGLLANVDELVETVPRAQKVAGSAHVCIKGVESEALLFLLDEAHVCASAASACASGAMEPSHVLASMGLDRQWTAGALRMSLGHTTTASDVDRAVDVLVDAVAQLRRGSSRA